MLEDIGYIAARAIEKVRSGHQDQAQDVFSQACEQFPSRKVRRTFVRRFALEAARAMDEGNYRLVENLYKCLSDSTIVPISAEEIDQAFKREGGSLELIPVQGHSGRGMLYAVCG